MSNAHPIPQSRPVWYLIPTREPVYACHWTGKWVREREVIWTGAIVPGVRFRHASAPGYEAARRQHIAWFNENDRNCNTCVHLERVSHPRDRFGFLYGKCKNPDCDRDHHPYREAERDGVMMFHPNDWMGMTCHLNRK